MNSGNGTTKKNYRNCNNNMDENRTRKFLIMLLQNKNGTPNYQNETTIF